MIYSDNAKTFKKVADELQTLWKTLNRGQLQEFFSEKRIQWKFIVERAAWWGGMWERMVRSVKMCLKKILGKAFLRFEELQTFLIEVEAVIDSRPLTYLDSDENLAPLTPAHFLTGERLTVLPMRTMKNADFIGVNAKRINKRWQYRDRLLNQLWKRWRDEYLLLLKSAHASNSTTSTSPFKIDDIVLIYDHLLPRQCWKIGRVQEIFTG